MECLLRYKMSTISDNMLCQNPNSKTLQKKSRKIVFVAVKNWKTKKSGFFLVRVCQGLENNERVRYPIAESRKKSKKAFFYKPHTQHENTSNNLAVCKVPSQENNKKYFSHKVKILPG